MPAPKQIHIVDDDPGFLKGIGRLLAAHGLDVRMFSSAEDFRTHADPNDAACLILDIHLGSTSGIDLMQALFQSGATTPVVLVTASDSEHTRQAAFAAGCSAFLQKPVSGKVLLDAIRNAATALLPPQ